MILKTLHCSNYITILYIKSNQHLILLIKNRLSLFSLCLPHFGHGDLALMNVALEKLGLSTFLKLHKKTK